MQVLSRLFFKVLLVFLALSQVNGQKTVDVINGSFEGIPTRSTKSINGWYDCGGINFPEESPPDIHPSNFWANNLPASEGATYLGLVVRDNGTYESVSQRLTGVLEAGKCYEITLHLARAPKYESLSHMTNEMANYVTPCVIRILGGLGFCHEQELLAESDPISNDSWRIYKFEFKPKNNVRSITIQAFYKTPVLLPYNGNLLLDGVSSIVQKPCPGEIAAVKNNLPPHKRTKVSMPPKTTSKTTASIKDTPSVTKALENQSSKPSILTELNRSTIKEGQVIEIKKLEFSADTSAISKTSYDVLEEVYGFLSRNQDIIIEIGGHTNNVPTDAYCDKLSTARAKAVAEYLINRGINSEKIQFKGYGKRKPIADNKTALGRQKNQRVEIKILSLS